MDRARYARLHELVDAARALERARRADLIASVRAEDRELGEELAALCEHVEPAIGSADAGTGDPRALLAEAAIVAARERMQHLADDSNFAADAEPADDADLALDSARAAWMPDRIGPYRIVRTLGQGGMGVVYEAEQQSPRRRVALKMIHPVLVSKELVRRFRLEGEVLGRLNHPGIAQVYECGVVDVAGAPHPYFAMEYVDGVPITEFCDREELDLAERLRLFASVCDAVHHAHQKGVIHRDLKPSNVLVSRHEGKPRARVIDFGIAKAIDDSAGGLAGMTQPGQVMGTPAYMSPEQAGLVAGDVDVASDIYSLGVILYQILTGVLPITADETPRGRSYAVQQIFTARDPARPSTRVSTLGSETPIIARRRRVSAAALERRLRGDLDWITMKALEVPRERRYASASEFAADVRRHLDHEPVLAGPPDVRYRVGKFVRRNRALVGGTIAAVAALSIGLVGAVWFALGEAQQRTIADARTLEFERAAYTANINIASIAARTHDVAFARRSLDAAPASLRGWEHAFLSWNLDRSLFTLEGHAAEVMAFAISADGRRLVSADGAGEVRTWDLETGHSVRTVRIPAPSSVAIDPALERVLCAGTDGILRLRSLADERDLWTPTLPASFDASAFSVDGTRVVVGTGAQLSVLDAASGETLSSIPSIREHPRALGFDATGSVVLCAASEWAQAFDVASGKLLWEVEVLYAHFSGDRALVMLRERRGTNAELRDPRTGASRVLGVTGRFTDVHRAEGLVGGEFDFAELSLVDFVSGRRSAWLAPANHELALSRFTRDGRRFVATAPAHALKVWDAGSVDPAFSVAMSDSWGGAIDADCRRVVSLGWGSVRAWDVATGALRWSRTVSRRGLYAACFSPDGARIATGPVDGRVLVLSAEDGATLATLAEIPSPVLALAWHPDGTRIAAGCGVGLIRVLDAEKPVVLQEIAAHQSTVQSLAFAEEGRWLVSGSGDELPGREAAAGEPTRHGDDSIAVWDIATGTLRNRIGSTGGHRAAVSALEVSRPTPDGALLFSGARDGTIASWRLRDGQPVSAPRLVSGSISDLAFDPSGTRLFVASERDPVEVHDADSLEKLLSLPIRGALLGVHEGMVVASGYGEPLSIAEVGPSRGDSLARGRVMRALPYLVALFERSDPVDDVVASLRANPSIADSVRDTAIALARARGDQPNLLNSAAWTYAVQRHGTAEGYRDALHRSELACRARPDDWSLLNTLALCQYRSGDAMAARATAVRCDDLHRRAHVESNPVDLCFLAMACRRVGDTERAAGALAAARALAASPKYAADADVSRFLAEASEE